MSAPHHIFDGDLLRRRRARAAAGASRHDFLLRRVADDFAERLSLIKRDFSQAADIGAHHGVLAERLAQVPGIGTIVELDSVSAASLNVGRSRIVADIEALPIAEGSLDLAVSALALQLVNDVPGVLAQIRRALRPDGLLLAALLGGDTLHELRQAWLVAEDEVAGGASPRVAPFADVRELGGLLQRAGFALPVADSDVVRVTYPTPLALMQDIKGMGASNVLLSRRRVPVTRRLLLRAAEVYAERHALPGGRVPATFEIVTLTAWAPDEKQQKPLAPGSATVRLADVLARKPPDASGDGGD